MITIAPIPIPKELAERGYTPNVVAERLHSALDSLGKVKNDSKVFSIGKGISLDESDTKSVKISGDAFVVEQSLLSNINIPTMGVPVETLATSIRHALKHESRQNVSGEVTSQKEFLWLHLQLNGQDLDPEPIKAGPDDPDKLFAKAAELLLVKISENNIELDPSAAQPHFNLGIILTDQGKVDDAIIEYKKAIKLDQNYVAARINLGLAFQTQGKIDDAAREIRKAIELDKDPKDAWNSRGSGQRLA